MGEREGVEATMLPGHLTSATRLIPRWGSGGLGGMKTCLRHVVLAMLVRPLAEALSIHLSTCLTGSEESSRLRASSGTCTIQYGSHEAHGAISVSYNEKKRTKLVLQLRPSHFKSLTGAGGHWPPPRRADGAQFLFPPGQRGSRGH